MSIFFHNNCRKFSRAHWPTFIVNKRTDHEFIIYAMRQRAIADNLTICYRKKQVHVSFSRECPVIDNEFRHNIVKVVCGDSYDENLTDA